MTRRLSFFRSTFRLPLFLLFFFQSTSTSHLSIFPSVSSTVFFSLCPAFLLSVLVHFYFIWIILYQSTTESTHTHTHSDSLTNTCNEVHWCLSTERKVFLSTFSSHLMLRKSFHTWESSLTGTHTHACVGIIHATEKWCRSYKSQSATEYIRPLKYKCIYNA